MGDFMKKESKQHFLLSAKARTLSVFEIMQITHELAFLLFKEMRWGKEQPICPQWSGISFTLPTEEHCKV